MFFNRKLKQEISDLHKQYNLVLQLLHLRQDDVMVLQRQLAAIQPVTQTFDYHEVKEIAAESLRLAIEKKLDFLTEAATDEFSDFFIEGLAEELANLANSGSDF